MIFFSFIINTFENSCQILFDFKYTYYALFENKLMNNLIKYLFVFCYYILCGVCVCIFLFDDF